MSAERRRLWAAGARARGSCTAYWIAATARAPLPVHSGAVERARLIDALDMGQDGRVRKLRP